MPLLPTAGGKSPAATLSIHSAPLAPLWPIMGPHSPSLPQLYFIQQQPYKKHIVLETAFPNTTSLGFFLAFSLKLKSLKDPLITGNTVCVWVCA